jgi:uncharacterized protein YoaH (UPF0181 family)
MPLNYMLYKCGEGNYWLPLAEQHGFYVGFSDLLQPIEAAEYRPDRHPIGTRIPEENFCRRTGQDDDCIAWLTHENNRGRLLLITFDQRNLTFWQATAQVGINYPEQPAFEAARAYWLADPRDTYAGTFRNGAANPIFKTLPVERLGSMPRSELYTSIDSLSVYQFLNRGTCRPLWPISGTGPRHVGMVDTITNQRQESVRWTGDDETWFGVFLRLYLNSILHRVLGDRWPDGWANEAQLGNMPEGERLQLTIHTFNPILVETAALYFCLDLGLIADIGTGKGIDVIDIRARAESEGAAQAAADSLGRLEHEGVATGEAVGNVIQRLRERRVLEFQCKAADRVFDRNDILYFGYGGGRARAAVSVSRLRDVISVAPWQDGLLGRFVNMQNAILFG